MDMEYVGKALAELRVKRDNLDEAIAKIQSLNTPKPKDGGWREVHGKQVFIETVPASAPVHKPRKKHHRISKAGRKALSESMKKRWRKVKRQGKSSL